MFKKKLKAAGRAAALLCSIGIAGLLLISHHIKSYSDPFIKQVKDLPRADAILVLGAFVYPDGHVSDILRDRLDTSLEVYAAHKAGKFIVTGDHGTIEYDEVNAMKQYLMDRNVRNELVFMDHAGFNTYESLYRAKEIFKVNRLIIVTQDYHLSRAIYIARKLGMDAYGIAADKRLYGGMAKYKAREVLARNKDFINVNLTKPRPTYLGEVIPITSDGRVTNDK